MKGMGSYWLEGSQEHLFSSKINMVFGYIYPVMAMVLMPHGGA